MGGGAAPGKGGKDSLAYEDEQKRAAVKKLDLKFPLELKFGKAKGKAGMGGGTNAIALGCFTVIVG